MPHVSCKPSCASGFCTLQKPNVESTADEGGRAWRWRARGGGGREAVGRDMQHAPALRRRGRRSVRAA
eukprot:4348526-Prymnesium_polylepis.1